MKRQTAAPAAWLLLGVLLCASASAHEGKLTFAPVLAKVTPAVVNIRVIGESVPRHPLMDDPLFRRFFRNAPPRPNEGAGSGVIIDAGKGYVVTNHHVIDDADQIVVTLKDRREFSAELIGSDPQTDLALLKIDAEDLTALPFGDSERLRVGDFVVAIGNPFNLGQTVTSGIVSALGRNLALTRDGYEDFIQTDASINRGNSGGALVDLDGQLMGINTVILSPSGASAGVGFAVPSTIVRSVAEQLLEFGGVRRGQLGVVISNLTSDEADALGLKSARGVFVNEVMPDSSAESAGIEPGDVIVRIGGEAVADAGELRATIGFADIGEALRIDVVRDGEERTLEATLKTAERRTVQAEDAHPRLAGAEIEELSAQHALYGRVQGVEVTAVADRSPAAFAGIEVGDVVVKVNGRPVASLADFESAAAASANLILIVRRGSRLWALRLR